MNKRVSNLIVFILALLGLAVSGYLAYEYSQPGPIGCPLAGGGCDAVRNSIYSSFLGVPIPVWGIIFYFFILVSAVLLSSSISNKRLHKLRSTFAFLGVLFGTYLTYLEASVIKNFCFWCLTSYVISLLILFFCSVSFKVKGDEN